MNYKFEVIRLQYIINYLDLEKEKPIIMFTT